MLEMTSGRDEGSAAGETHLVLVGIVLHLSKHERTDEVADHQSVQSTPRLIATPPRASHRIIAMRQSESSDVSVSQTSQGVPVPNDAREPIVDAAHDIAQAHRGALSKVPKLVGKDPGKLPQIEAGHQWQSNRQLHVVAEQTPETASKARRGVDLAIDIDATWDWRADRLTTNPADQRKKQRRIAVINRDRFSGFDTPCESGLDQKQHQDRAYDQGAT